MTTSDDLVRDALAAPDDWEDTPEQKQLRECIIGVLEGHTCPELIAIGHALITLMRDQMAGAVANVRRQAALEARSEMSPAQLAIASGQSRPTIARLLVEARAMAYADDGESELQ